MALKSDVVTMTAPISYKRFNVPNFVTVVLPPTSREEGLKELPSVRLSDLPNEVFAALVEAWVDDMYSKHGQQRPARPAGN